MGGAPTALQAAIWGSAALQVKLQGHRALENPGLQAFLSTHSWLVPSTCEDEGSETLSSCPRVDHRRRRISHNSEQRGPNGPVPTGKEDPAGKMNGVTNRARLLGVSTVVVNLMCQSGQWSQVPTHLVSHMSGRRCF
jgi:hypothetical protein